MNIVKTSKTTEIVQVNDQPLPYCRFVSDDSFFFSVVFSYFEELCKPNKNLIKDCKRRLLCEKKFRGHEFHIEEFKRFFENPSQEILEVLKNNFGLFLRYKKILCFYYSKKHSGKYIDFPENFIKDSSQPKLFSPQLCKLLAKVTKLKIKCHYNSKPFDIVTPENAKQDDPCISIYIKNNSECYILYESPPPKSPVLVIKESKRILENPNVSEGILQAYKTSEASPTKPNSTPTCNQCHSFKESLYPDTKLCHNCIVINSITGNNPDAHHPIKMSCQSCNPTLFLFPEDFIPVTCPDNHDFLCKACWSNTLQMNSEQSISEKRNRFKCPLNRYSINLLSHYIFKILKIKCKSCQQKNTKYYGNKVCKLNCEICITCQNKENSKHENNFSCPGCNNPMIDKSGPWVENYNLENLLEIE